MIKPAAASRVTWGPLCEVLGCVTGWLAVASGRAPLVLLTGLSFPLPRTEPPALPLAWDG